MKRKRKKQTIKKKKKTTSKQQQNKQKQQQHITVLFPSQVELLSGNGSEWSKHVGSTSIAPLSP